MYVLVHYHGPEWLSKVISVVTIVATLILHDVNLFFRLALNQRIPGTERKNVIAPIFSARRSRVRCKEPVLIFRTVM